MGRAWRGASLVLIITAHDVFMINGGNGNGNAATGQRRRSMDRSIDRNVNGNGERRGLGHWGNRRQWQQEQRGNGVPIAMIDHGSCVCVWTWGVGRGRGRCLFRVLFDKVSECQKEVRINE
jgi:hypothetical protein